MFFEAMFDLAGPPFSGEEPFVASGPALIYLLRRFGYPTVNSDPVKEVCAYALPTAREGVYLGIHVGGTLAFIALETTRSVEDELRNASWDTGQMVKDTEIGQACIKAGAETLRDLLKPVKIRDVWVNLLGEVPPSDLDVDPTSYEVTNDVDPWHAAGIRVPEGCYDNPRVFLRLIDLARETGDGNVTEGMKQIIERILDES
jgi:hypothetical protein